MKDYKQAVVIGRFQPFHSDHLKVVEHGLEIAEQVIVVIGSANAAPSTRNPWTLDERIKMIHEATGLGGNPRRLVCVGVRDHFYNDNAWLADVQAKTSQFIEDGQTVALLGTYKDASSYWLNWFPQWEFIPVRTGDLNSTAIREALFDRIVTATYDGTPGNPMKPQELGAALSQRVPLPVFKLLKEWVETSKLYPILSKEFRFQKEYKESWASSPFPPTFVTADAVVVCCGHVLVIERKINPGKGLFALPGGFVRQNELIEHAALRELREETGLKLKSSHVTASEVFDYPTRSERGRTITHAYYCKLDSTVLPQVKGGDDAKRALWMPLFEAFRNEEKFFEDHLHIVLRLVGAQGER